MTEEMRKMLSERGCKRILVGMSGGLDSTYAALELRECGYDVEGAMLRMTDDTDLTAARIAAEEIGIPLHIIDAREAFDREVKEYFAQSYAKGETPNPCVVCNRRVKVKFLCDFAGELGFDHVSTGHYARILRDRESGRYFVSRADDPRKDQSYMLWQLTQKQLSMLITPLADTEKNGIRAAAAERGLHAAASKESQDICFLPDGAYADFVEKRLGSFPAGDFLDENGKIVGQHRGIVRYTVGQRKGLGLALGHPVFVSSIDAETNTVRLASAGKEYSTRMTVSDLHFQRLAEGMLTVGSDVLVKIRYAAQPARAVICRVGEKDVSVAFAVPQRAVTPGQSAVFYDAESGMSLLFGGRIASEHTETHEKA